MHTYFQDIFQESIQKEGEVEKMIEVLKIKAEIFEKFGDVFEIHVVDERTWRFYKRFIDAVIEI